MQKHRTVRCGKCQLPPLFHGVEFGRIPRVINPISKKIVQPVSHSFVFVSANAQA